MIVVLATGSSMTQNCVFANGPNPQPRYATRHVERASRFADIESASFFGQAPARSAIPLAPPPAPADTELTPTPAVPAPVPAIITPVATQAVSRFPACRPVQAKIQQTQGQRMSDFSYEENVASAPVDDPRELKKITEIQPYFSYEPNPLVRAEDPCRNLCPRPDGRPCENGGDEIPACPEEVVLSNEQYQPRQFPDNVFAWEASNVYYNPLYFQDVALERYGHTYPCFVQPFASVGKFGVQLVGLPYQMGIDPICKKMYPLGYYRPGECTPKLLYQIPWNTRAAITQAGVTTGLIFLIP